LIYGVELVLRRSRRMTGDGREPVSFGHSSFCLFLYGNWHKKNIRGITGERERRQGEEGEMGFTGDVEFCQRWPQMCQVSDEQSRHSGDVLRENKKGGRGRRWRGFYRPGLGID
jgi:hypothetical protein